MPFRFRVKRKKTFSAITITENRYKIVFGDIVIVTEFVTRLLKVVDTCFWAQSDCNILQVY